MEFSVEVLTPPSMEKTHFFSTLFKILSITHFDKQIIICLILKVMTTEVEVKKSKSQPENLT